MQTEKYLPLGSTNNAGNLVTKVTKFPALFVDPKVDIFLPMTLNLSFIVSFIFDIRVGISLSELETDDRFYLYL